LLLEGSSSDILLFPESPTCWQLDRVVAGV
jgi:hypothetical protein